MAFFIFAAVSHRILEPSTLVGWIVGRLLYVPAYRLLKSIRLIRRFIYSLAGGDWGHIETMDPAQLNKLAAEFSR